jgi:uncharacterized protein with HEPN domain
MSDTLRLKASLTDIKAYAATVIGLTKGLSYSEYQTSRTIQLAVERCLSIIGEAAVRIRNSGSVDLLPEARQIIGFRNVLIHSYDGVDQPTVWVICTQHVPALLVRVEGLLQELG